MKLLTDSKLHERVQDGIFGDVDLDGIDWKSSKSPIQAATLDLSIGKIIVPEKDPCQYGGLSKPFESGNYAVPPGSTVVVETREQLDIPSNLAGFGFPPASVAVNGLLMVNAGFIDPGYKGGLSLTLINMGKEPYTLEVGRKIFTTQWFQLDEDTKVEADYSARSGEAPKAGVSISQYSKLSHDFLDVDKRAWVVVGKAGFFTAVAVALIALIGNLPSGPQPISVEDHRGLELELMDMQKRVHKLELLVEIDGK
jgi:dCTP deaminase